VYKRVKQLMLFRKDIKLQLESQIERFKVIRSEYDIIAICPNNTTQHWLGIKQGTAALFPHNHVCLEQSYSNTVYNEIELQQIIKSLASLNFKKIIFRGFPSYFSELIRGIKKNCETDIYILYAGPASEFMTVQKQEAVKEIVKLANEGVVKKVGFNKKGLSEAISSIYNIECGRYILKAPIPGEIKVRHLKVGKIRIGIFGGSTFNKNIHTQILAALAVPNSEVHVLDKTKFSYLHLDHRIVGYDGYIPHEKFVNVLSSMDINLYLAYSESWGNLITESLAFGVPCLATINSGVFDYDEFLKQKLIVMDYDNISAIKNQIEEVLLDYSNISEKASEYVIALNKKADEFLCDLLQ
jgi:glycosyltransferase involved in cell wall biosynthesis